MDETGFENSKKTKQKHRSTNTTTLTRARTHAREKQDDAYSSETTNIKQTNKKES
jgi:hypothetical protein